MVQMIGGGAMGQRRRYLAEQEILMEELFGKAEGFTTPITKPVASFKAPKMAAPKITAAKPALKPTGGKLPTSQERLNTLKEGLQAKIGQTGTSTGAPSAVGTTGGVGKGLKSVLAGAATGGAAASYAGAKLAKPLAVRAERAALRRGMSVDAAEGLRVGIQTAGATLGSGPGIVAGARAGARLRRKGKFQRTKPSSVAKSFIPGVGYRSASQLTAAQRAAIRNAPRGPRGSLVRRGPNAHNSTQNADLRDMASLTRGGQRSSNPNITFGPGVSAADRERVLRIAPKKLKGGKVHVDHYPHQGSLTSSIFQPQPEGYVAGGSRRVPSMLHLKRGTGDHTIAHEFTHANRKSLNAHRIGTITSNKTKLGREEGRADAGAARQGYRPADRGAGSFDYEQAATLSTSRNRLHRWGQKKLAPQLGGMDRQAYADVRRRMGVPISGRLQPSNERLLRTARRRDRTQKTINVIGHPATPAVVGAVSLPIAMRQQKKQEAERKARASAAYQARKARKAGVTKALKVVGLPAYRTSASSSGKNAWDHGLERPKIGPKGSYIGRQTGLEGRTRRQSGFGVGSYKKHTGKGSALSGLDTVRAPHRDELDEVARQVSQMKNSAGKARHTSDAEILVAAQRGIVRARRKADTKITKREPLKTHVSDDDARKLVDRYNLKGPLPKNLSREQKMAAYEARYVSAGGKKAEKWDRRARVADKVKTGGLAVATGGGAAWLATRGRLKSKINPRVQHSAETIAGAGAVAGGAGELYASHARRKRSSYASAPAGVAASALRRMRDYTP